MTIEEIDKLVEAYRKRLKKQYLNSRFDRASYDITLANIQALLNVKWQKRYENCEKDALTFDVDTIIKTEIDNKKNWVKTLFGEE